MRSFQSNLPWVTIKLLSIEGEPQAVIDALKKVQQLDIPFPSEITDHDPAQIIQKLPVNIAWKIPEPRANRIHRLLEKAGGNVEFIKKRWMLSNYLRFFENEVYWTVYLRTIQAAFLTTFASLVISYPVAFYIAKLATRAWRTKLLLLLLIPFWVSELIRIFAWLLILGEKGVLNQFLMDYILSEHRFNFCIPIFRLALA